MREHEGFRAGQNPRPLTQIAANALVKRIPVVALPAIELFLSDNELFDNYVFPNKFYILVKLKKLKDWFWKHLKWIFGEEDSAIRLYIEEALTSCIDYHCEVMTGPRDQQLFTIFVFQLLFQYSAGKLPTAESYGVDHLCNNLRVLMEYLGRSETCFVSLTNIVFHEHRHLISILKYVPELINLNLHTSFHPEVSKYLQEYCPKLQILEMEFPCVPLVEDVVAKICKFFFCGATEDSLYEDIVIGKKKDLSFPSLKALYFRSRGDHDVPDLSKIAFFIQFFHPTVKVNWHRKIKGPNVMTNILNCGIPSPPFILQNENLGWDSVGIHSNTGTDIILTDEGRHAVLFRTVDHIYLAENVVNTINDSTFIGYFLSRFSCSSLEICYSPLVSQHLSSILRGTFSFIKKLYLTGPLYTPLDGKQLYSLLHNCIHLHVLGIKLDLVHDPGTMRLMRQLNLQEISIKVKNYPDWEHFPIKSRIGDTGDLKTTEYQVQKFIKLNLPNHCMPAYLCSFNLLEYLSTYYPPVFPNNEDTPHFSFISTAVSERFCENCRNRFMWKNCSLNHLSDIIYGAGVLKYDIPVKKMYNCGYGVLEHINFNAFPNHGYFSNATYRLPHFSFYGNKTYGVSLHNVGGLGNCSLAYKKSGHRAYVYSSYQDIQPIYKGFVVGDYNPEICDPDTYGHLKREVKDKLAHNRSIEENENKLKQWRPDMTFSAPVSLLRSLIHASPNLMLLEIPDLRITDVDILYLDIIYSNCLAHLHSLHLSSQFSYPLVELIKRIPSLRTLSVDPSYGTDNFLRFKRSLQTSSLMVSCSKSRIWPEIHTS